MDTEDKKILENEVSVVIGKAVMQWLKKNDISDPVVVTVSVTRPSCYVDELGVAHSGPLANVSCEIVDGSSLDFDDDDDDEGY